MTDVDLTADEYVGDEVYDPTGTFLGTVGDVDEDGGVLYVDPDPDPTEEAWANVGGGERVNYDNDWLGVADYKTWNEGDADDAAFEEWPYTVTVDEIERIDDDAIHLESASLTDVLRDLVPFLDSD